MTTTIQPHTGDATALEDPVFHLCVFGNFSGSQAERETYEPRAVNRNRWDALFESLAPALELTLDLPKQPDQSVRIRFEGLGDFGGKGLAARVPLLAGLRALRQAVEGASPQNPAQSAALIAEFPALAAVKNLAEAHGSSKVIDLLSMVDIGEGGDDEFSLPELAAFFAAGSYAGEKRAALLGDVARMTGLVRSQIEGHAGFRELAGFWCGLRLYWKYLGPRVRLALIDCTAAEYCDATFMNFVKPDEGAPLPLDLAIYAAETGLDEDARHNLHYLSRMAAGLNVPFVLSAAPEVLGCKAWPHLTHVRDVSTKMAAPTHIKWHKHREDAESQWLFLAANPFRPQTGSDDDEETAVWTPASFYPGLLVAFHLSQGKWPSDMTGPLGHLSVGTGCAAALDDEQGHDLAFHGICAVAGREGADYLRLLGMTCYGHIRLPGREQLQAANLIEYTLSYRFFAGCVSRFLQRHAADAELTARLRHFAGIEAEDDLVHEEVDGAAAFRIKAPFKIFGVQPDLILALG